MNYKISFCWRETLENLYF